VLLQKSCIDVAVLLIDCLHRSDPFPLVVRTVVGSGAVIYSEGFGAELVWAEPIFLDVGFPVSAVDEQMPAADQSQVFAADTATDEVDAIRGFRKYGLYAFVVRRRY
jgi:hypothetical protein